MHDSPPLDDYPKTVVLADGIHVVLRPHTADDQGRMETMRVRAPGPGGVVIVAVDGERIAGVLTLDRDDESLQIALEPDYRGRRLGIWMLLDAVHLATDLGMARLVVHATAGDDALRAALDRLDFQSEVVGGDGTVVFRKTLHRGWPGF